MPNEIVKYSSMDGEEITLTVADVRQKICPKASDKDIMLFMAQAKMFNANPWANEIYLTGYDCKDGFRASVIMSYHVFNRVASSQKDYDGIESGVIVFNQKTGKVEYNEGSAFFKQLGQVLVGGWAKVWRKGVGHPFSVTVNLEDFNKGTATWKSMASFMIEKVAKGQAWRLAYPSLFENVYIDGAEIARTHTLDVTEVPNTDGEIEAIVDGETIEPETPRVSMDAKQALWNACKAYADAVSADPKVISDGIKLRPDYEESNDYFYAIASELEQGAIEATEIKNINKEGQE